MEGGQLIFLTDGKGPHEYPFYCHQQILFLDVVVVLIMVHPCHDFSDVIFKTNQDEDKSNFIFF